MAHQPRLLQAARAGQPRGALPLCCKIALQKLITVSHTGHEMCPSLETTSGPAIRVRFTESCMQIHTISLHFGFAFVYIYICSVVQSLELSTQPPVLATVHEVPGHEMSHDSINASSPLRPSVSPHAVDSGDGSCDDRLQLQIAAETIVKVREPTNSKGEL